MHVLEYDSIDEMVGSLVAKEKRNYFLCTCPSCGANEAFLYKNNLKFLKCNRENNCGESFMINYKDDRNVDYEIKSNYTKEQIEEVVDITTSSFNEMYSKVLFPSDFDNYRGLEKDVLTKAKAIVMNDNHMALSFLKYFADRTKYYNYAAKYDMSKNDYWHKYNIIFPLFNSHNQKLERFVFRSDINDLDIKELVVPVHEELEATDILKLDLDNDVVIISESIIDGLSVKQSYEAGLYSMRGVGKSNKLIRELDNFKNKLLLLCLDNDEAGLKETNKIISACEAKNINYVHVELHEGIKDFNELLLETSKGSLANHINDQVEERVRELIHSREAEKLYRTVKCYVSNLYDNEFLKDKYLNTLHTTESCSVVNNYILNAQIANSYFFDISKLSGIVSEQELNRMNKYQVINFKSDSYFYDSNNNLKKVSEATMSENDLLNSKKIKSFIKEQAICVESKVAVPTKKIKRSLDLDEGYNYFKNILEKYQINFDNSIKVLETGEIHGAYLIDEKVVKINSDQSVESKFLSLIKAGLSFTELDEKISELAVNIFANGFIDNGDKNFSCYKAVEVKQALSTFNALNKLFEEANLIDHDRNVEVKKEVSLGRGDVLDI